MTQILGTSFATSGFSYDPNLSPNNQSFSAAVIAVLRRSWAAPGGVTATSVTFTDAAAPATPGNGTLVLESVASPAANISQLTVFDAFGASIALGFEQHMLVYNGGTAAISAGNLVYVNGAHGNQPTIALAKADSQATMPAVGWAQYAIPAGSFGEIHTYGLVSATTNSFAVGDEVYVSDTVAGALTNVSPNAPSFSQNVGVVTVSAGGNGGKVQFGVKTQMPATLAPTEFKDVLALGTNTAYPWAGGTSAFGPALQLSGAGGLFPQNPGIINLVAGAYFNGTNFIFTGTGTNNSGTSTMVRLTVGTGQFSVQGGGAGTYGGTATANTVMTVNVGNGQTLLTGTGNAIRLQLIAGTSSQSYMDWYGTGGTTRRGYFGYGNSTDDTLILANETANGTLSFRSGSVEVLRLSTNTSPVIRGFGPVAGGLVDMTPDSGTFNGTATGLTTSPASGCAWSRNGNQVTLSVGTVSGSSNATSFSIGQLPAALSPARSQVLPLPDSAFTNNTAKVGTVACSISAGGSSLVFLLSDSSAGFTAAGTKGVTRGFTVTYLLN
jgi:hypothetical protein